MPRIKTIIGACYLPNEAPSPPCCWQHYQTRSLSQVCTFFRNNKLRGRIAERDGDYKHGHKSTSNAVAQAALTEDAMALYGTRGEQCTMDRYSSHFSKSRFASCFRFRDERLGEQNQCVTRLLLIRRSKLCLRLINVSHTVRLPETQC